MSLRPPPSKDIQSSPLSLHLWYQQIKDFVSQAVGVIPWDSVNKTGSDLVDLATRRHNDLTNFQGGTSGEYYHLTAIQHTSLTTLSTITASGTTALDATYGYVLCNATLGAQTITLPAATLRKRFHIKKIDAGANAVTVQRTGSDTIEGSNTYALATQYKSVTVYGNGSTTYYIEGAT